jgi:hypothetical protein
MKKITLNEELTRIQEMMGVKHISPSGKETNMSPDDDDYEINYGKNAIEEISPSDIVGSMREEETDENVEEAFDPSDSDGDGVSDCCGAPIVMGDICSDCGEHCEAEEEYVDEIPGFEGTRDALDDLGIREEVDEESAIGGWDLAMESIDELQKELEEEEGSWMAMRAGKDGKVFEGRPGFQQETFFDTQAGALESAEEYAKHKGFVVNWESITPQHVAYEKTVQYHVEILKDGKPLKKMLQISLYRMPSGKYELTNYIM